jgi:hypothetical protein
MIDLNKVYKVYNGRAGLCACGCSGKYTTASQHKEFADKARGYETDDVNDVTVRKIVGKILSAENPEDSGMGFVYAIVGKRMYVAYTVGE